MFPVAVRLVDQSGSLTTRQGRQMTSAGESPAGARRRVRLAVRRARIERDLTQQQVADEMDWSLSKVMRIENGEVTIAPNDLRPLLGYLGIKDRTIVTDLLAAAKLSKQRKQWWDAPNIRLGLTSALHQVVQLEPHATAVRSFYPLILPAYIQTPAYSRAILTSFSDELPSNVIEARLAIRDRRREGFLTRSDRPTVYAILDESVLLRQIGGKDVLVDQLKTLIDLIDTTTMHVRIIPLTAEAPVPMLATFEITYLHEESEDDAILYRESDLLDQIVDDPDQIRRHRGIFERLWSSIHDESASVELINLHLKSLTNAK
jgi:transcriptional regulator with XRE-family HTH domain